MFFQSKKVIIFSLIRKFRRKSDDENFYKNLIGNVENINENKLILMLNNKEKNSSAERINQVRKNYLFIQNSNKTGIHFNNRNTKTEENLKKLQKDDSEIINKKEKNETSNNFISNNTTKHTLNTSNTIKSNSKNKSSELYLKTTPTVYEAPGKDTLLYEKYDIGELIGQGSYASVKVERVAVKTYEKVKISSAQKQKNVQREIVILTKMNHKNVIKLIESIDNFRSIHLIMEYVGHCSLLSYIKIQPGKKIQESIAKKIYFQLVQTLIYLHSKCIIHRDIKLENIIVYEKEKIKLIDFGFSICIQKEKKLSIFCGTPTYMAPEIVSKKPYSGAPVDIWASGILLYAMLFGKFPFRSKEDKELYKKISLGVYEIPNFVSEKASNLIRKILNVNPNERITAEEILNDEWFLEKKK